MLSNIWLPKNNGPNGAAVTFNPAWLSDATIRKYGLNTSNGNITNYIVRSEILNSVQTFSAKVLSLNHLGEDGIITNWSTLLNPVKGIRLIR